ncbi:MAG: ABC-ATPase domain-containing protein [Eubacterium sp.]|nr:ABC-ATPase domain-containing protein [Eubacterium sp.]
MKRSEDLQEILRRIDHRGYPAYKDTAGSYQFGNYVLGIDHVQGDPFAAPSKASVHVGGNKAGFPAEMIREKHTRTALEDALIRRFGREILQYSHKAKGSGKSGILSVSRPGQEVLRRSACEINPDNGDVTVRLEIGFPANGRTINAGELKKILFQFLPECVQRSLFYHNSDKKHLKDVMELAQDQQHIRHQLEKRGLAAFVADGAILPRESGVSDRPMKQAVPFYSPESMAVVLTLPNKGPVRGMGIPRGVTLIAGGGYHGKSTLLKALERGVYNHIAGDGREYVITDDTAVKIRAEDGRSIQQTDISMFINGLPNGKDTKAFQTEDASGSTSQAANVIEAMEAGTRLFLIDEDTSATNFMIRDELMARVVHQDMEPITPFIDRVEELFADYGISTILVAGSCGSYFRKADHVIQMMQYEPSEITQLARQEAERFFAASPDRPQIPSAQKPVFHRVFAPDCKAARNDRMKIKGMGRDGVVLDHDLIELRYVEQLVDSEQTMALGYLVKYARQKLFDGKKDMRQVAGMLEQLLEEKGFQAVCGGRYLPCSMAVPRVQEIYACLNRCRELAVAGLK